MTAPAPSIADQTMQRLIDHPVPELDAFNATLASIAAVQPGERVLFVTCERGTLIVEVLRSVGENHGLFVCLDVSHLCRQQTALAVEASGLEGSLSIINSTPYDLSAIIAALSLTLGPAAPASFDVIFAFRALPADMSRHQGILHYWAALLTPNTGRLIVSGAPTGNTTTPLQSAVQAISSSTRQILLHANLLSDAERHQLRVKFLDTLRAASLTGSHSRVLTRRAQARRFIDLADECESSFQEWLQREGFTASWATKAEFLALMTDWMETQLLSMVMEGLNEDMADGPAAALADMMTFPETLLFVAVARRIEE
jgi:hypothetical protein